MNEIDINMKTYIFDDMLKIQFKCYTIFYEVTVRNFSLILVCALQEKSAITLALQLANTDSTFNGRTLRVSRCKDEDTKQKLKKVRLYFNIPVGNRLIVNTCISEFVSYVPYLVFLNM